MCIHNQEQNYLFTAIFLFEKEYEEANTYLILPLFSIT